jgi:thymidylate synthase (FAD)
MAKFVNPSVKTINQFAFEKYGHNIEELAESLKIELSGRSCYDSFNKIDFYNNSDVKFSKNLIKSGHEAVIEFGQLHFKINNNVHNKIPVSNYQWINQTFSNENGFIMSGNIRAWRNLIKNDKIDESLREYILYVMKQQKDVSFMFDDIEYNSDVSFIHFQYNFQRVNINELKLNKEEKNIHKYFHFVLETTRSVMSEITRHRLCGFAIQSQRYVKYDNVEFIVPHWYNNEQHSFKDKIKHKFRKWLFRTFCQFAEFGYSLMIKFGMKAEDARELLPNATKTIINICANLEEFNHIFSLRSSKAAYPNIRIISDKMKEFVEKELENV